jgi:hypothetical protein
MPYNKMQAIVSDLVKAQEYVNLYIKQDSSNSIRKETFALYHKVFSIHHTNSKIFLESFDYYLAHPKLTRDMFDSLYVQSRRNTNFMTKPAPPVQ